MTFWDRFYVTFGLCHLNSQSNFVWVWDWVNLEPGPGEIKTKINQFRFPFIRFDGP